jgi:hypothetical protein
MFFFCRDHHSIATQTKNNIKTMGYKVHNTYNHGRKGDSILLYDSGNPMIQIA